MLLILPTFFFPFICFLLLFLPGYAHVWWLSIFAYFFFIISYTHFSCCLCFIKEDYELLCDIGFLLNFMCLVHRHLFNLMLVFIEQYLVISLVLISFCVLCCSIMFQLTPSAAFFLLSFDSFIIFLYFPPGIDFSWILRLNSWTIFTSFNFRSFAVFAHEKFYGDHFTKLLDWSIFLHLPERKESLFEGLFLLT